MKAFVTSGDISNALLDEGLDAGLARVGWILRSRRREIVPVARAGPAFLFDASATSLVRTALLEIDARRQKQPA